MAQPAPQTKTQTITINLTRKLRKLHAPRRKKMASTYLKEEVARYQKVKPENVKIGSDLNRHLVLNITRQSKPIKLNVEKTGDVVNLTLFGQPEKKTEETKPKGAQKASQENKTVPKSEIKPETKPSSK